MSTVIYSLTYLQAINWWSLLKLKFAKINSACSCLTVSLYTHDALCVNYLATWRVLDCTCMNTRRAGIL